MTTRHRARWTLGLLAATSLIAAAPPPRPLVSPPPAPVLGLPDPPQGFPPIPFPPDDPPTPAKVELGRRLFFDRRLSGDGNMACATCHRPERAFTDGRARAVGATGELHPRGTMSLANVAYTLTLTWADPSLRRLEEQALAPLLATTPVEMGTAGREAEVLARLRADPDYPGRFAAAFAGEGDPFTLGHVVRALAAFERTLVSGDSPVDRFLHRGEPLPGPARRGLELFVSERLACSSCHGGFTFGAPVRGPERSRQPEFHNTGLYDLGDGRYPLGSEGLAEHTGRREDRGHFRAPTLRNVAVTAPYLHDGSLATLAEVVDHYAAGGRRLATGPFAGDGRGNPWKSALVRGFTLTAGERADLVAFLDALTDPGFLTDPRFADPFAIVEETE